MPAGLISDSGRVLMARLLKGDALEGITHCAIGDGDGTFTDPLNPPSPSRMQTALKHERARKKFHKRSFLAVDPAGQALLVVNGVHYLETVTPTNILGVFFVFDETEANGITVKEYGFFGGGVTYVQGHVSDYAEGGVYHAVSNPSGKVLNPGYLYEVKNLPDFNKVADTRIELVGVIKV